MHYKAHQGLQDKGRAIKGFVVCYVLWLGSMIYWMGLWTCARCVGLVPFCGQDVFRAQVPQHPIDTYSLLHIGYITYCSKASIIESSLGEPKLMAGLEAAANSTLGLDT